MIDRFNQSANYQAADASNEIEATTNMAPMLNKKDMQFIATTQVKIPQREIMQMYVGNYSELSLKQRR